MSIRTISALFGALALAGAGSAYAQPYDDGTTVGEVTVTARPAADLEVKAVRVSYEDLDLSAYAGGRALLARINGAAKRVCSPEPSTRSFTEGDDYNACLYSAMDRAVDDVGDPNVADLYRDQYR